MRINLINAFGRFGTIMSGILFMYYYSIGRELASWFFLILFILSCIADTTDYVYSQEVLR